MIAQDYNMTLEEALEKTKHRPDFQKKLKHSVDLLRKAEKLALKYDAEDGFYLAFSAGKDSQAMFHVAQMGGGKIQGSHELYKRRSPAGHHLQAQTIPMRCRAPATGKHL